MIIYTDLDGTALTDWDRGPVVPRRNLEAIQAFTAAGGAFSVASGREAASVLRFFPDVTFRSPLVCGNGAVIYDAISRRILRQTPLPAEYKAECAAYVRPRPGLWIVAADSERIYQITFGDPAKDAPIGDWDRPFVPVEEFLSDRRFIKVVYVLPPDGAGMPRLERETSAFSTAGLVTEFQSSHRYLEVVERTVSKAEGIRFAREAAGLADRRLVCIGDYFNDLPMLRMADIAACPSNGVDELKAMCSIVTCCNNDGALADLIQKLYLM